MLTVTDVFQLLFFSCALSYVMSPIQGCNIKKDKGSLKRLKMYNYPLCINVKKKKYCIFALSFILSGSISRSGWVGTHI